MLHTYHMHHLRPHIYVLGAAALRIARLRAFVRRTHKAQRISELPTTTIASVVRGGSSLLQHVYATTNAHATHAYKKRTNETRTQGQQQRVTWSGKRPYYRPALSVGR